MEKMCIKLHIPMLFAVLNDGVVQAVAQAFVGGTGRADGSVMKKIDNLRKDIDGTRHNVLPAFQIETSDATNRVDERHNIFVLTIAKMKMRKLLIHKTIAAEIKSSHLGIHLRRNGNQRGTVIGRHFVRNQCMLRIDDGQIMRMILYSVHIVLHINAATMAH